MNIKKHNENYHWFKEILTMVLHAIILKQMKCEVIVMSTLAFFTADILLINAIIILAIAKLGKNSAVCRV